MSGGGLVIAINPNGNPLEQGGGTLEMFRRAFRLVQSLMKNLFLISSSRRVNFVLAVIVLPRFEIDK